MSVSKNHPVDAGREAHDKGEPSENDGQRAVHNNNRVHIGGNKKFHKLELKLKCQHP